MREHPILFSAPMVRAILAGTKTQTRRVSNPVKGYEHNNVCRPDMAHDPWAVWWHGEYERVGCLQQCPYGVPGDYLWVRETWTPFDFSYEKTKPSELPRGAKIVYLADQKQKLSGDKYRPSIFMPRWASRITLEITDVRVQRVQEISEDDAIAEGIWGKMQPAVGPVPAGMTYYWGSGNSIGGGFDTAKQCYGCLWDRINGKRPGCAWADNPWVWVVAFRKVACV